MCYKRKTLVLLSLIFIPLYVVAGLSQEKEVSKYPRGAQYFLGTEDELLMKVNIWGFVNKPGQYMVPSETDLISLISYAGGPSNGAKLSKIKIVHAKGETGEEEKITEINVKKFLNNGQNNLIPRLQPGDTIIVDESKWHHINSFVEFSTKIALLAQIYYLITYYSGR